MNFGYQNELHRYNREQAKKQRYESSAKIFAVCVFVIVAFMVAQFVAQVIQ